MDRELSFSYDNDLYFGTDQYYTSGANIVYGRLLHQGSKWYDRFKSKRSDSLKVIARLQYGHKIFTPSKIKNRFATQFDRPYAGWHYIKFHVQNFHGVNSSNLYRVELGLVGKQSGIGNFHVWWHEQFGFPTPKGWKYQISNEVILNLAYNRQMMWSPVRRIGFYSNTGVKVGNGMNMASQELVARYGKANRLINSAFANSRLDKIIPKIGNKDPEEEEGFLFYGFEGRYMLSNIFIEGSLINQETLHTEDLETFVLVRKWGFMYSNYYTTFYFTVYKLSKEVVGAKKHRYVSLNLIFRF